MLWLVVAGTMLRLIPLKRLFRELPPGTAGTISGDRDRKVIAQVRVAVAAAARILPWHPRCLPRALAGLLMCRIRGLQVPVALGVIAGDKFAAHARLEPGSDVELAATSPAGRTHLGRMRLAF